MATTTRGFHYPALDGIDTPDVPRDIKALADDADAMWSSGTFAARPAASIIGREYYATNTGRTYLDTGSAWVLKGSSTLAETASPTFTGTTAVATFTASGTATFSGATSLAAAATLFFQNAAADANATINNNGSTGQAKLNIVAAGGVTFSAAVSLGGGLNLVANADIVMAAGVGQVFSGGSGDATDPDFTFTGDTDTGMFRSAANALGWTTGGTERMTLSSAGSLNVTGNSSATTGFIQSGAATGVPSAGAVGDIIGGDTLSSFQFDQSAATISLQRTDASVTGPSFTARKARGTGQGSPAVVTSGDDILLVRAYAYGGAAGYIEACRMTMETEGTIADSRLPGRITFFTGTDAAPSVMTNRMSIDSAGLVHIVSNSTIGGTLDVTGAVSTDGNLSTTSFIQSGAVPGAPAAGGAADIIAGGTTSSFQFDQSAMLMYLNRTSADSGAFHILGRKARGTGEGSPAVITTGDDLFLMRGYGYGGAAGYIEACRITFDSEGTIADSRVPGKMRFATGTDAAPSVLTERMTIDSAGLVAVAAAMTVGTTLGVTGIITATGGITMADAQNIVLNTTTGTKIGTANTQKLGFYNQTPVVQPAGTGETTGFTAGAGTPVTDASTFTGNVGTKAYRINDVVKALKNIGLIASS